VDGRGSRVQGQPGMASLETLSQQTRKRMRKRRKRKTKRRRRRKEEGRVGNSRRKSPIV
jgi:hypothetical protein